MYVYIYIYIHIHTYIHTIDRHANRSRVEPLGRPPEKVKGKESAARPGRCRSGTSANLRTKILDVQRVWLKHNLNYEGWNSHVHGGLPRKFESSNISRDNLSGEIGRSTRCFCECERATVYRARKASFSSLCCCQAELGRTMQLASAVLQQNMCQSSYCQTACPLTYHYAHCSLRRCA